MTVALQDRIISKEITANFSGSGGYFFLFESMIWKIKSISAMINIKISISCSNVMYISTTSFTFMRKRYSKRCYLPSHCDRKDNRHRFGALQYTLLGCKVSIAYFAEFVKTILFFFSVPS